MSNSTTPLADALAGVDATMGTEGNPYGDPARELAALRDLAEAVRAHLLGTPQTEGWGRCIHCGRPALTPEQLGWGTQVVHVLNGTVHCMAGSAELPTVAELDAPPDPIAYAKGDRVAYTVSYSPDREHPQPWSRAEYGRITRVREQAGPRQEARATIAVEDPKPGRSRYVERYTADIAKVAEGIGRQPGPPEKAEPEKVYDGYTQEQLTEAFALVKNPENWKLPIAATVPLDADRACISAAVSYFTGSMAEFIPGRRGLHVGAAGYYACIGS